MGDLRKGPFCKKCGMGKNQARLFTHGYNSPMHGDIVTYPPICIGA